MEESRVKLVLNLESIPPDEILEEIIEEEAFQLRDYFLRNPVISVLFKSRIRKLKQLHEIASEYLTHHSDQFLEKEDIRLEIEVANFKELFKWLEFTMSLVKVKMSSELRPLGISSIAEEMIIIQELYEREFRSLFEAKGVVGSLPETVKAADQILTGKALKLLDSGSELELEEELIKEYTRIKLLVSK